MKKLAIISAIALSGLIYNNANAQVRVSVGFNLGGPVVVQRPVVVERPVVVDYADDYYYMPEVDAYYSRGENLYYYNNGYSWVSGVYLPGAYRTYSWRNVPHYAVHAYRPYMNHNVYRTKYRGNAIDWRRFDNRNDRRDWDRHDNRPDWNNRGNNRPDWNDRNDNRGNWNNRRNNGRFERPSNDNRGGRGGYDGRSNFAANTPARRGLER